MEKTAHDCQVEDAERDLYAFIVDLNAKYDLTTLETLNVIGGQFQAFIKYPLRLERDLAVRRAKKKAHTPPEPTP